MNDNPDIPDLASTSKAGGARLKRLVVWLISLVLVFMGTRYYYTASLPFVNLGSSFSASQIRNLQKAGTTIQALSYQDISSDQLLTGALSGMVQALEDPYSAFLDQKQSQALNESMDGSFDGIGAEIMSLDDQIVIVSPIQDSPAERAGLQANDVILSVDGQSLAGKTSEEAVALIRGQAGSQVSLEIKRGDSNQKVAITRDTIPLETVKGQILSDSSIGHIQISSFAETTYDELVTTIENLRQQGAKSFVLDLRGNPGGLLTSVVKIANIFLTDGDVIVKTEDGQAHQESLKASDQEYGDFKVTEPVSVLIDEGSASASEILAGALQQSAKMQVVGQNSFGKGTVQSVVPIGSAGDLKITTAHWLTPNGDWINEKGIKPNVTVSLPDYASLTLIDASQDYQLGAAGEAVLNIKRILYVLGYSDQAHPNDLYDDQTVQAVRSFQTDHNLSATGQVDGQTAYGLVQAMRDHIKANDSQLEAAVKTLQAN